MPFWGIFSPLLVQPHRPKCVQHFYCHYVRFWAIGLYAILLQCLHTCFKSFVLTWWVILDLLNFKFHTLFDHRCCLREICLRSPLCGRPAMVLPPFHSILWEILFSWYSWANLVQGITPTKALTKPCQIFTRWKGPTGFVLSISENLRSKSPGHDMTIFGFGKFYLFNYLSCINQISLTSVKVTTSIQIFKRNPWHET